MFQAVRCMRSHKGMTADNELKILRYIVLTQMKGLGPASQNALLDICGDIEGCFKAGFDELTNADAMKLIRKCKIRSFISQREDKELWTRAERILQSVRSSVSGVAVRGDPIFPGRFMGIKDIPVMFYTRGRLRINEFAKSIGIVGARRCSSEGKKYAIDIATEAIGEDAAVISGMAKGIDAYAHTAAMKASGYTIAVLGNGVDICYPKEHERLYEVIAERGCIVSEYPPGTIPREYNFPKRNRLIAALSDKLYVIEAGRNSGTRSTVENCVKYGREVVESVRVIHHYGSVSCLYYSLNDSLMPG